MATLFLSHANADNAAAQRLAELLAEAGYGSLFLDFHPEHGIPPGADWQGHLQRKLAETDVMVALLSPASVGSFWCHVEFGLAWDKGKLVIPLKIAACDPSEILARIQVADATGGLEVGLPKLVRALQAHGLEAGEGRAARSERAPYPGIASFEEADAPFFFGRSEETRRLVERLARLARYPSDPRLLVLVGPSGGGKSSLLKAGVLARLRKDPAQWRVLPVFRPGAEPLAQLERAPAAGATRADGAEPGAVELVAVDQLEELFTRADPHATTAFLTGLRDRLGPGWLAVATLRSGLLGELQGHPVVTDPDRPLRLAVEQIEPLRREAFAAAVRGPAQVAGVVLEDELVGALVADAAGAESLPLLAVALRELWEGWRDTGVPGQKLTLDRYRATGGLAGAVERVAAAAFRDVTLGPAELKALRDAFVPRLVRRTPDGGYARLAAPLAALPAAARPALRRLVEERLLVAGRDGSGAETVEVAHEALFATWPLLRDWLAEDARLLELDARLEGPLREWLAAGRSEAALVPDSPLLTLAAELREAARDRLDADRVALIEASLEAREARLAAAEAERERKLRDARTIARRTAYGLVVALLLGTTAGGTAWVAVEQADVAEEQRARAQTEQQRAEQNPAEADRQRHEKEHQLAAAQIQESRRLADLAHQHTEQGDAVTGMLLALRPPNRTSGGSGNRSPHRQG